MKTFLFPIVFLFTVAAFGQDQLNSVDVQKYNIHITLSDDHDSIVVWEQVDVKFLEQCNSFYLNLKSIDKVKGMKLIHQVSENGQEVKSIHKNDTLWITPLKGKRGTTRKYEIFFAGIPETGLIIGKNKFENRTFFGDNWPNRAQHWFACIDHPSDKAKVKFQIVAPNHYECIATGTHMNSYQQDKDNQLHVFESNILLPTKVMVIGLANFVSEKLVHKGDFPMTAMVYEEDADKGFHDMAVAAEVTDFFTSKIGSYPFEKLANVQSTTQFGGMENAGNIFYDEHAVTGKGKMEALIAHEIAHQWFGNSVSESDWQHLWLSEGFATYFTDLYWEHKYGTDAMNERLIQERERIFKFSKQYNHPVVDTTYESLMNLLNPHSYQKGAWFLHMLRNKIGDESFWKSIRAYYKRYQYGNASTADFKQVVEEITHDDLSEFFNQWLHQSQHPKIRYNFNNYGEGDIIGIYQRQNNFVYKFNLEIELTFEDGTVETKTFYIDEKTEILYINEEKLVSSFRLDPNVKLLYEFIAR